MKPFGLTVLGSSSALPTSNRYPSAHVLTVHERLFLIDCGEGTQIQLRRHKIRIQKIQAIFISHLHGDHYLGLPGLVSTMSLLGRNTPLTIYGPEALKEIMDMQLKYMDGHMSFELNIVPVQPESGIVIYEDEKVTVSSIKLYHRIPCTGFLFKEKPLPANIRKEAIEAYDIPIQAIPGIKEGDDFTDDSGRIIPNRDLVIPSPPPRTFAYCSDTAYQELLLDDIRNADLLYHEATFLSEHEERARETFHSTAAQAATIARKAGVSALVVGHFSARYKDLTPLLEEAAAIFPNTRLAQEGQYYDIPATLQTAKLTNLRVSR
ncbi:MAG: ribonuclease Z [Flavobacteriales bacterium]|nr:ribonuclease Z [Flavobacteriales bacterium]MCB9448945.1 ribonuclease Z [Flavobacteriales bacterium]